MRSIIHQNIILTLCLASLAFNGEARAQAPEPTPIDCGGSTPSKKSKLANSSGFIDNTAYFNLTITCTACFQPACGAVALVNGANPAPHGASFWTEDDGNDVLILQETQR